MDLDFTDEQDMLRELVRGVCTDVAPLDVVREMEDDPIGYPDAFWKQLAALDLIGLTLPTAFGGSEMSLLEATILYEELGRSLAPSPHFPSAVDERRRARGRRNRGPAAGVAAPDRVG